MIFLTPGSELPRPLCPLLGQDRQPLDTTCHPSTRGLSCKSPSDHSCVLGPTGGRWPGQHPLVLLPRQAGLQMSPCARCFPPALGSPEQGAEHFHQPPQALSMELSSELWVSAPKTLHCDAAALVGVGFTSTEHCMMLGIGSDQCTIHGRIVH